MRALPPNQDLITANAFTSTGTMSEATKKFGQTGAGFFKNQIYNTDAFSGI